MASSKIFDVLIVGGGPAGLSTAAALVRQQHTALILDSGAYRNERTRHMHNVAGWDHADPEAFRAKARADLMGRYSTVEYRRATVTTVRKVTAAADEAGDGVFEAVDDEGVVSRGRKLLLATGVRDKVEDEVDGYAECWGRGIFHCLFCHGYEERGADSVGALLTATYAKPEMFTHLGRLAKRLSGGVHLYTNGDDAMAASLRPLIASSRIAVDPRPIASLRLVEGGPRVRVSFADGTSRDEGFIASAPPVEQRAAHLVRQLGLETTPAGDVAVTGPFNETSVPGCFAAGDLATPFRAVVQAMHMGSFAAVGAVAQLQAELEAKDRL